MKAALLPDRGVVKVAGDVAREFLNGLLTADIGAVAPGQARFAALLTIIPPVVRQNLTTQNAARNVP